MTKIWSRMVKTVKNQFNIMLGIPLYIKLTEYQKIKIKLSSANFLLKRKSFQSNIAQNVHQIGRAKKPKGQVFTSHTSMSQDDFLVC